MIRLVTLVSFWTLALGVSAQNDSVRYDYMWYMGYDEFNGNPIFGTSVFDFNNDTLEVYSDDASDIDALATNATVCDADGNFIFFTNGAYIFDASQTFMQGGDTLSTAEYVLDDYEQGLFIEQGALALPHPGDDERWHLFHKYVSTTIHFIYSVYAPEVLHTTIDMSLNGGLGGVETLGESIMQGFLTPGELTACRHANGRDWWLLFYGNWSNEYHTYLLDPDGLHDTGSQIVGDSVKGGLGTARFSTDGSKFIRMNTINNTLGGNLDIYDFDRCTGELSNQLHINYPNSGTPGVSTSPSSQYLYVCRTDTILQYDLWASDIAASETVVAVYDGIPSPLTGFSSHFSMCSLAPDGKIYVMPATTQEMVHVIHHPDSGGVACEVEQKAFALPHINRSMPNFPHYRLGRLEGSACDTVYNTSTPVMEVPGEGMGEVRIYPNPARDEVRIDYTGDALVTEVVVYDISGRRVASYDVRVHSSFSITGLPPGMYLCQVKSDHDIITTQKLLVE